MAWGTLETVRRFANATGEYAAMNHFGTLAERAHRIVQVAQEEVQRFRRHGTGEHAAVDRFDKFTERARKVLHLAQEEAQRLNHNYIGTEHLLLGLIREGEGVAAKVLTNLGARLDDVRSKVEFIIGRGDRTVAGDIGLTPRAKRVIELSVDEARRLKHHFVGTEHLLLGLVREGEGIAAGVLESLGVSLDKTRLQVLHVLQNAAADSRAPEAVAGEPWPGSLPSGVITLQVGARLTEHFYQLDEATRRVLWLAQGEAVTQGHAYTGTEHLLLGLLHGPTGIASQVLAELDVTAKGVEEHLAALPSEGDRKPTHDLGLTARAKRAIELAVQEAQSRNVQSARTEHLLLGLVAEGEGVAVRILDKLGASPDAVRAAVERRSER
jgi:ATP-dependent Clp protease ATP-binding subunit ClpA